MPRGRYNLHGTSSQLFLHSVIGGHHTGYQQVNAFNWYYVLGIPGILPLPFVQNHIAGTETDPREISKKFEPCPPVPGRHKIYSVDFSVVLMIGGRGAQIPEGDFGGWAGVWTTSRYQ